MSALLRVISTGCLSVIVGAIFSLTVITLALMREWEQIPIGNLTPGVLAFITGFLLIVILHKHLHRIRCVYGVLVGLSVISICGGFILGTKGYALYEAHISTKFLSELPYLFMILAGISACIIGLLLLASGGCGYLSRWLSRRQKNLGSPAPAVTSEFTKNSP